jgi:NADH:ubiquinone oxidoreductase subunit 5 (subunit L)/multisubunit Na+/H+ antiporter MnhA subunit
MPTPALLLLIATLLPLVGFGLLIFAGKRIGNPLAGWLSTVLIFASLLCTLAATVVWLQAEPGHYQGSEWGDGTGPINIPVKWIPIGLAENPGGINQDHPGYLDLAIYVDSLTLVMFATITLLAVIVHIFSIGYMLDDPRFERFFTYLSLLCFAMLALVIGGTLLHLYICWVLVALCAYLLIAYWHESQASAGAALSAVVVNGIGSGALLIGFGVLFRYMGNASLPDLWTYLGSAGSGQSVLLPGGVEFGSRLLTFAGIAVCFGALASSAQFPLQVWLPTATAAPMPGNALLQTAATLGAGVYLVARIFPILTPNAKLFIALIGLITLTMGALVATVQTNLKRLLAYAAISQAGYMMLAMGIGSWTGGLFHLVTHCFVMSLLVLAAGSVMYAVGHETDLSRFGGLWRKMPMTALTSAIAVLAIAGTPYLSAWSSRIIILRHAAAFAAVAQREGHQRAYTLFFILPAVVSYLTAFYMARCWMLIFWGKPRDPALYDQAREFSMMWGPLGALAFMCIVSGRYLNLQPLLESSIKETQAICRDYQMRDDFFELREDFAGFKNVWPTDLSTESDDPLVAVVLAAGQTERHWLRWAFLIGVLSGLLLYLRGYSISRLFLRIAPVRWIQHWLLHAMYFDELYLIIIVGTFKNLASVCDWVDRKLVDGALNRAGRLVRRAGRLPSPRR